VVATPSPPPAPGPTGPAGLTAAEVADRVRRRLTNARPHGAGRTLGQILRANVVTPFNLLLGALAVAVLATGSWRDALFGVVIVANSLIGVVQEVRAKRALDRLEVLSAPRARVVRDGRTVDVATTDIVLDDLLELHAGDQVVADGVLLAAEGLEVDEALLTGESDHVAKAAADPVMSGSIVMAGSGRCQVTAVGPSSFAGRIAAEAQRFSTTSSELMGGINRILKAIAFAIPVIGPVLFVSQRRSTETWQEAVQGTVAGLVGIVPEGLVLLTSIAFMGAALTLARRRVLVRELPAVEGLARIDVMCVDKTGTLTAGDISFDHLEVLRPAPGELDAALGALAAGGEANATLLAVRRAFPADPHWEHTAEVAFSSARKWSAVSFAGHGTWVLGAPEMVAPGVDLPRAGELAAGGARTLLVAHAGAGLDGTAELPPGLEPVALLALHETLRPDAAEILGYFDRQHVAVKVISGDSPRTVAAVARRAGLAAPAATDARDLPAAGAELGEILDVNAVFGRVVPEQKRSMVAALQGRGHVVAMTGDGVNDALALKDADIGVAMGSGAPATRSVAQIVLLDDEFAAMPAVVAEGRRVIANIERVASLFLTKNVVSLLLSLSVAVARWPYPFLPRQVTLVSTLAIGLPGFFLALGPNTRRFEPGFVRRVLWFAAPAGVVTAVAVMTAYGVARAEGVTVTEARTAATIVFLMASLWVLAIQARPLLAWKAALVGTMAGLGTLAFALPQAREFFELRLPGPVPTVVAIAMGVAAAGGLEAVGKLTARFRQPA
jgi:cation-transporting ATPase E